ncbi:DNA cytosine methyltransferase [Pseudogulbenkiania sp. NH8B]|uniref:DNA cytosine methyltransferase n=1 Tax=Pseudogulbenkiania sp. (strain NH8B) TaxID=748280 RepID=UPI00350F88BE
MTEDHGEALLTWYREGFRARTSPPPGGGTGIDGTRSGLWREMARIIGEVRPRFVFVENSPLLVGRGLAVVLGDLAALGYDAQWACLSASDLGAPHQRDRIWIVAYAQGERRGETRQFRPIQSPQWTSSGDKGINAVANANSHPWIERGPDHPQEKQRKGNADRGRIGQNMADTCGIRCYKVESPVTCRAEGKTTASKAADSSITGGWRRWPAEPNVGRVAHGVAHRVDRLKALGNGQVSRVAAAAWVVLGGA